MGDPCVLTQESKLLRLRVYATAECCNVLVALLDVVTGGAELSENNRMLLVENGLLGTAEVLELRTQIVDIGRGFLLQGQHVPFLRLHSCGDVG